MKVSAGDPTSSWGFLLWAASNLDLWTETPTSSWHAQGEAHPPSVRLSSTLLHRCEPPSAKRGELEAHFKVRCMSKLMSSKDFRYINVSILMYLKYFQLKLEGIKMI